MRLSEAVQNEVEFELDLEESLIAVCSHSPPALSTISVSSYLTLCQLSLPSVSNFLKGMGFALCASEYVVCFNKPYLKFTLQALGQILL